MAFPQQTRAGLTLLGILFASACAQVPKPNATLPSSPSATPAAAQAQPAAAGPGASVPIVRLPGDVRPTRQSVELEVIPEREFFTGRVEIALQLSQSREDLWISSRELTLTSGTFAIAGETLPLTLQPDDATGVARLQLPHRVSAGEGVLVLAFRGAFNPRLAGLYRVKSRDRWYAVTQFEAVEARRAFPCFDEPSFKIPWDVALTVPANLIAVANTSVVDETASGTMKRVRFRTTRPLPSYLVAFAVGDFDVVTPPPLPPNEVRARPLQVRGIATKGRGSELGYALRAGGELLVMLERWFGREFPYEKLDHLAVPDFEYGAMENAGLITYREQALLVDPRTASEDQKLTVAVDMAHEMAHQWFGDLVTMAWWDDLWLNESFASLMEVQMTAAWAKGNRYDLKYLSKVQEAMATDELSPVHPIRPQIEVEGDIFGIDYGVVYPKGAQVIAMFQQFLGPEAFRAAIRAYLDAHADGNATRGDLMAALSAAGTDVAPAMRSFVDQPGIPLVQATLRCEARGPRVALKKSRNLPLGSPAWPGGQWEVPVCVRTDRSSGKPECLLLKAAEAELPLQQKSCPAWIALNPGAQGYYRWTLPPAQLRALLARGYRHLSAAERMSLGSNLAAALRSGALPAADVLAALEPLARDPEPAVSQEPAGLLKVVREFLAPPEQRAAVEAHMRSLHGPLLARLGWKARPGEPERVQIFRPWLIDYLAFEAMDQGVLERAASLGRAYLGADGHLHPEAVDRNLVQVSLKAAARLGSPQLFETMLQRLNSAEDSNVRENLLAGLGQFTDPQLAERARALALGEGLRVNELDLVLDSQTTTLELRPGAWAWLKTNFQPLATRLPQTYVQYLAYTQLGCSEEAAKELGETLESGLRAYPGGSYSLAKAMEKTRVCAAKVARQRPSTAEFFRARPGGARADTAVLH
jgi:cytosol alanyl aminopeptidase